MELFYSEGGRSNPDFVHKVRVSRKADITAMMEWCNDYDTGDKPYFKRYYIDWRNGNDSQSIWSTDYATFQFEWEEAAIMFALKFGAHS